MMQEFTVSIFLIILVYLAYVLWVRPLKMIKSYVRNLKKLGYNVMQVSYNPFKNDMISSMREGSKHGDSLKLYKQERRNYDVIVSNSLNRPRLQFHHPDFIKDFYSVDKHYQYPKTSNIVEVFANIAGNGLFFSQGQSWKRKRNIFNKIFNFDFIKKQSKKISSICSDAIKQIQNRIKKNQNQKQFQFPVIQLTTRMFSNVMMQIFLGGSQQQLIQGQPAGIYLKKIISEYSSFAFGPINFLLGPKFINLGITKKQRYFIQKIQKYRDWGLRFVKKRIFQINKQLGTNPEKKQPSDIIQALLISNKLSKDQMTIASQKQIFQQFTSFFIAGTDTTSNFTQMMIYQIARHPQVEKKVRQQIQSFMKDQNYSYQNLKNLSYIQMVQKQISRTYGPINTLFSRKCKVDNYLNGLPIKKNTGISISFIGNHFSQKYFTDPKQFRPERWQSQCQKIPFYAIGGFGGGARTCIGKHLALMQNKIAIIKIMKRYKKLTLPNANFKMLMRFTYCPEDFDTKMLVDQV